LKDLQLQRFVEDRPHRFVLPRPAGQSFSPSVRNR
jgi:hypothetical protein